MFGSEKIRFESQASREDDILSHSAKQGHLTNHGVSKQTLKVKGKGFKIEFKGIVAYLSYCSNPVPFLNGLKMLVCALF